MRAQQPAIGAQSLGDALGVVEPVDGQDDLARAVARAELADPATDGRVVLHQRASTRRAPRRSAAPGGGPRGRRPATRSMRLSRPSHSSSARRKLCRWLWVWNAIRSAPSRPRSICSRCGRMPKTSDEGNGTCRKNPMRASGATSRTRSGYQEQLVVVDPDEVARLVAREVASAKRTVGSPDRRPRTPGSNIDAGREAVQQRPQRVVRVAP